MTTQVPDTLTYLTQEYRIAGVQGERFPTPAFFGRKTADLNGPTNCYRGYLGRYAVITDHLVISTLSLGTDYYSPIQGIEAIPDANLHWSGWRTYPLNLPSSFTGGVIIGQKGVAPYFGLGHPKPYSYQVVLELVFTDGRLKAVDDRSTLAAEIRDRLGSLTKGNYNQAFVDNINQEFASACAFAYDDLL